MHTAGHNSARLRYRRPMVDPNLPVATLVLDHAEAAGVFQRHHIDFCVRGHLSLAAACAERGLSTDTLVTELERAISRRKTAPTRDPRTFTTPELILHIVSKHHGYVHETLAGVGRLSTQVLREDAARDPRLEAMHADVQALCAAWPTHLSAEEEVLFPALSASTLDLNLIRNELENMAADHLAVGGIIAHLREVSDDFTVPEWAGEAYRTLFQELRALEMDTLLHVHLENQVLMPRFADL